MYITPFHDSLHHSMYLFLPSPPYINPFRDSLHHSMYITPCPLLFLPSPLYINPFHDSLHHSMYLFLPSPLYFNPFHDSLHHSMYLFLRSPLYINPFDDSLHHYMYISTLPLLLKQEPCRPLVINLQYSVHFIILCLNSPLTTAQPIPGRYSYLNHKELYSRHLPSLVLSISIPCDSLHHSMYSESSLYQWTLYQSLPCQWPQVFTISMVYPLGIILCKTSRL